MFEILQYLNTIGPLQLIGLLGYLVYTLAFGWVQIVRGWTGTARNSRYATCWLHPWWR